MIKRHPVIAIILIYIVVLVAFILGASNWKTPGGYTTNADIIDGRLLIGFFALPIAFIISLLRNYLTSRNTLYHLFALFSALVAVVSSRWITGELHSDSGISRAGKAYLIDSRDYSHVKETGMIAWKIYIGAFIATFLFTVIILPSKKATNEFIINVLKMFKGDT